MQAVFLLSGAAYAEQNKETERADGFFNDFVKGITGSVYRSVKSDITDRYRELKANVEKQYSVGITPNDYVYEVKASAQATGNYRPIGPEYKFAIFINSSDEGLHAIKEVKYDFLHPTFDNQHVVVENADEHFLTSYIGWGCLTSVGVTVELKDGTSKRFDFNMCRSLGPDWIR